MSVVLAVLGSLLLSVCAAQASASEVEWRQGGGPLTEAVGTKWKGSVTLTDEAAEGVGHPATLKCEESGEGLAGPGAVDEETKSTWAASCTLTGTRCEAGSERVERVNLPWRSELVISEGTPHDLITSAKGAPGLKIKCDIAGVEKVLNECTGTLRTSVTGTTGGVSAVFDGKPLKCEHPGSIYPTSTGTLEGSQAIEATKGGKLEVIVFSEWRQGGSSLGEAVATKSKGTVKLTDEEATGGPLTLECETAGEGTVGPKTADEESKWTASNCVVVSGACEKGKSVELVAVHLPWRSELVLSEEATRDVILSSGKGVPGFQVKCYAGGIFKTADECTATALRTGMTNVTGGVDATFDGEKLKCKLGGTGAGKLEGTQLIEATKGGKLEVTT